VIDRSQDTRHSEGLSGPGKGRRSVWNSCCGTHLGSGHVRPRQQTGHMIAIASTRAVTILASRGRPHMSPQPEGRGTSRFLVAAIRVHQATDLDAHTAIDGRLSPIMRDGSSMQSIRISARRCDGLHPRGAAVRPRIVSAFQSAVLVQHHCAGMTHEVGIGLIQHVDLMAG
jgi:hypothetical protein